MIGCKMRFMTLEEKLAKEANAFRYKIFQRSKVIDSSPTLHGAKESLAAYKEANPGANIWMPDYDSKDDDASSS